MAKQATSEQPDEHFFRHQYTNIVAALTRKVGAQHLGLIEDAAQSSLLKAWELWKVKWPPNPEAWLIRVATNDLIDTFRKQKPLTYPDSIEDALLSDESDAQALPAAFESEHEEDLLHLIFVCCEPSIPKQSSLVLALKVLCGFSVEEIALRLFTTEANVYKRYQRAKNTLKSLSRDISLLTASEMTERLDTALNVLYLLFTEGYLSHSADESIRKELCEEAFRLVKISGEKTSLHAHPQLQIEKPKIMALQALMAFNLARLNGRTDSNGNLLLLEEQNRSQWNRFMISQGFNYLAESADGDQISRYHLEAAIAAEHCRAPGYKETNWQAIEHCYQQLESISPSYIYRLNRVIALAEWKGPQEALQLLNENPPPTWMAQSYLWLVVAADIHHRCGLNDEAGHFQKLALECAPTDQIHKLISKRC